METLSTKELAVCRGRWHPSLSLSLSLTLASTYIITRLATDTRASLSLSLSLSFSLCGGGQGARPPRIRACPQKTTLESRAELRASPVDLCGRNLEYRWEAV